MIETFLPLGVVHVYSSIMVKWLLTVLIVLVILAVATPWIGRALGRRGFARIPGDFQIPVRGRTYYVPFASTVVLSLLVYLIGKFL
jgi:hypothetical protein